MKSIENIRIFSNMHIREILETPDPRVTIPPSSILHPPSSSMLMSILRACSIDAIAALAWLHHYLHLYPYRYTLHTMDILHT